MNLALLVLLLLVFWGLSVYLRDRPNHPLRLVIPPVAGLYFLVDAVLHPERRAGSLLFTALAAGMMWRTLRARRARA